MPKKLTVQQVAKETETDPVLKQVIAAIQNQNANSPASSQRNRNGSSIKTTCQATDESKYKASLQLRETPNQPFINLDIVLQKISKYKASLQLRETPNQPFINLDIVLQKIFAFVGIPVKITLDNGPPFNGKEFEDFFSNIWNQTP
ncbi:hypothetical protein QE152_g9960 [Popillia japonica]|uniref:Integrase catalytic domain-containing protein n=1 Tax=Popillia japonica TaxID=7064 RepID=A0AAW1LT05_POPJA